MVVHGIEIKPEVFEACRARMRARPFNKLAVEHVAAHFLPPGAARDFVVRFMHAEREAGRIEYDKRISFWLWVKT